MAPYRYRGESYRLLGNTNRRMSRDDEHRMFLERVHGQQRWENQTVEDWSLEDLDISELRTPPHCQRSNSDRQVI